MGPTPLAQVLCGLPKSRDERLIVGADLTDDAGVYKVSDDLALVVTIDVFTPIVDDPYTFGQIAAANSFSDVYAMGGTPICALNFTGFPEGKLALDILQQILQGGFDKAAEAGVAIAGGHSLSDDELKYGLSVVGTVHPGRIVTNAGARPGDALVLTKPIGTGIIATALRAGSAEEAWVQESVRWMTTLNRAACEAMQQVGVNACTDVTGFGLLGHLQQMLAASGVAGEVWAADVAVMPGARLLAGQGVMPGGLGRNRSHYGSCVTLASDIPGDLADVLYDPQTSGGLLLALPQARVGELVEALTSRGVPGNVIGQVTEGKPGTIRVVAGGG